MCKIILHNDEMFRSAFKIFTGTPTGNKPLGRPRRRCEGNIRVYLKEIGINTRNWIDPAHGRAHVNVAMNLWVP